MTEKILQEVLSHWHEYDREEKFLIGCSVCSLLLPSIISLLRIILQVCDL